MKLKTALLGKTYVFKSLKEVLGTAGADTRWEGTREITEKLGINAWGAHCTLGPRYAQRFVSWLLFTYKVKVKALVSQLCLTLCDPMDCSPPGSPVHGILQARILEWVTIPFSRGSF